MCDKGVFKTDTEALHCQQSGAVTYWNKKTVRRTVSDVTFKVPTRHSSGYCLGIPENDTFTGGKKKSDTQ